MKSPQEFEPSFEFAAGRAAHEFVQDRDQFLEIDGLTVVGGLEKGRETEHEAKRARLRLFFLNAEHERPRVQFDSPPPDLTIRNDEYSDH